jgi:hypothetical protein
MANYTDDYEDLKKLHEYGEGNTLTTDSYSKSNIKGIFNQSRFDKP